MAAEAWLTNGVLLTTANGALYVKDMEIKLQAKKKISAKLVVHIFVVNQAGHKKAYRFTFGRT
jgi:hypothetical protein